MRTLYWRPCGFLRVIIRARYWVKWITTALSNSSLTYQIFYIALKNNESCGNMVVLFICRAKRCSCQPILEPYCAVGENSKIKYNLKEVFGGIAHPSHGEGYCNDYLIPLNSTMFHSSISYLYSDNKSNFDIIWFLLCTNILVNNSTIYIGM